jgi:phytoene desaturase
MLTRVDRTAAPGQTGLKRPHAVVIGSGLGGLAAGVRLGARGYRVTVLEKLDAPGGRAYVFKQDGFTFDAGPTIITAPFLLEELWSLCGKSLADDVELRSLSPFYGIRFDDGSVFEASANAEAMREEVRRISPADVRGYDTFFAESEAIYRVGFEQLGHVPFSSLMDMARIAPQLVKLGVWRSVHDHVAKHLRHPKLRMALSFHPLFIGGNPFRVTAIYSLIAYLERAHGVHAAIGGTGRIVQGLARLIEGQGGEVRCDSEVAHISEKNGRATGVVLASGESIAADIVVSNADSATTYGKLLPPSLARGFAERRMAKARYSMSLFVWYFGTNKRFPNVRHHTILMGPRYRELLEDIFERKILADDMSLYLHRPTATDPSLAPPGCDSFYVLSPVPNQDSGIDWTKRAESYRQAIAARLEATELPGFEQHIVTSRIMTPIDFEHRLNSYKGAAFGLEPVFTQSAWFRPHNKSQTLEGLYLVGAGTHPGAGVPGVLSSARVLDTVVPDAAALA